MGLKCRISYQDGVAQVTDERGNPSQLYSEVLSFVRDQDLALDVWATAYTEDFGNKGEQASVYELVKYFDSKVASESRLSESEKFEVKDFMIRNGINSLNNLHKTLTKIFKPLGVFYIDARAAVNSGLYSQDEIKNIDADKIQDLLLKIEGQLAIEDIVVQPEAVVQEYKNTDVVTAFGAHPKMSQQEIDREIIKTVTDFSNPEAFRSQIQELPLPEFVDRFMSDEKFATDTMERFRGLKKVPVLSFVGGQLSTENNKVYTTVRNTVLTNVNNISIEAEIEYLESIDQDIWDENPEAVAEILREVEKTFASVNIDVIGIADNAHKREEVMRLLEDANNMLQKTTDVAIMNFADSYKAIMPSEESVELVKLDDRYSGYNIVSVKSRKSDSELFEKYGLIKIADGIYHKVDQRADINPIKDYIYEEFVAGRIQIPSKFILTKDLKNKPEVLEGISRFLMSRPVNVSVQNRELYSAYQVAFDHAPAENKTNHVSGLTEIKTNEDYLKTSFIADFYGYILEEKLKNSDVYRSTLSKFEINDRDITLKETIESIDNIKYSEELADYIRLKKDSDMKYLVKPSEFVSEDLLPINFPETVREYDGNMIIDGEYVITEPTSRDYVKVNGELYRKEMVNDKANLFVKIVTPQNPVYYASSMNFAYDQKAAKEVFDKYGDMTPNAVDNTQFQQTVAKSRYNDNMAKDFREKSTMKDNSYSFVEAEGKITAFKDGVPVGSLKFTAIDNGYVNPILTVDEAHRGKGVGTDLYLRLFDKVAREDKVFYPAEETKQAINVMARTSSFHVAQPNGGVKFQVSAYHGSPHRFNKFTTAKMGTGEGEQAFGWGLYFTTLRDVAADYAKGNRTNRNNRFINLAYKDFDLTNPVGVRNFFEDQLDDLYEYDPEQAEELATFINWLDGKIKDGATNTLDLIEEGNVYSVTLHKGKKPSEYDWLDWYGPVTEDQMAKIENEVVRVMSNPKNLESFNLRENIRISDRYDVDQYEGRSGWIVGDTSRMEDPDGGFLESFKTKEEADKYAQRLNILDTQFKGSEVYEALKNEYSAQEASMILLKAGIDGVKYPAESLSNPDYTLETARGINYVVFDENAVEIEEHKFDESDYYAPVPDAVFKGIVDKLQSTNLSNEKVVYDRIRFVRALKRAKVDRGLDLSVRYMMNHIAGVEQGGVVYINPKMLNVNTPIHEFGHLWTVWARDNRPDLYDKGAELILGTPYYKMIKEASQNPKSAYFNMNEDDIIEEALVQAIGDKGEQIVTKKKSADFRQWLTDLWTSLKDMVGLIDRSTEEVANMTMSQFAEAVAIDLVKGTDFAKVDTMENIYYPPKTEKQNDKENTASIFDSKLQLLDLYSPKEETEISDEIDSCGR